MHDAVELRQFQASDADFAIANFIPAVDQVAEREALMVRNTPLTWHIAILICAALLALLWSAPLLWALSTALRPEHEAVSGVL